MYVVAVFFSDLEEITSNFGVLNNIFGLSISKNIMFDTKINIFFLLLQKL